MTRVRMASIAIVLMLTIGLGFASLRQGEAATLEGRWSLYQRANSTSFVSGGVGSLTSPGIGYEIVSLDAAPLSTGLATYVYGGPDLPPAKGGPMAKVVDCTAAFTPTNMHVVVSNGYPYAGCVFFLGVTNTGDSPLAVNMGGLTAEATITCPPGRPDCGKTDIDVLAGGADDATIRANCRAFDASGAPADARILVGDATIFKQPLTYTIPVGVTWSCPLFLVVLQPALEDTTYIIVINPPPIERPPVVLDTPPESPPPPPPPGIAPPVSPTTVAGATAVPPAATPTPVDVVQGVSTPGALATPAAPATGTGLVVRNRPGQGIPVWPVILMACGLGLSIALAWPAGRSR